MRESFAPKELRAFLCAVDRRQRRKFKMTVIGGSSIALTYGVDRNTSDIDTLKVNLGAIWSSATLARCSKASAIGSGTIRASCCSFGVCTVKSKRMACGSGSRRKPVPEYAGESRVEADLERSFS